jgi:hypothetical protein
VDHLPGEVGRVFVIQIDDTLEDLTVDNLVPGALLRALHTVHGREHHCLNPQRGEAHYAPESSRAPCPSESENDRHTGMDRYEGARERESEPPKGRETSFKV